MSYFFRRLFHLQKDWDPSKHPRHPAGTPVDESGAGGGRFARAGEGRGAGDKGAPGPAGQGGYSMLAPVVVEALSKVRDTVQRWAGSAQKAKGQPGVKDKDTLLAQAKESKPLYDRMMESIAGAMRGTLIFGNENIMAMAADLAAGTAKVEVPMIMVADIKGGPRLDEKAQKEYGGDFSRIKDMVRGTVLVPGASLLDDALEALERQGVQLVDPPKDRVNSPGPEGYRDVKLNVLLPNGHIGELQVMTPAIFVAKMTKAHDYYAEIRPLLNELERSGREPTPTEWAQIERVNRIQNEELYGPAWQEDVKK